MKTAIWDIFTILILSIASFASVKLLKLHDRFDDDRDDDFNDASEPIVHYLLMAICILLMCTTIGLALKFGVEQIGVV